MSRKKKGPEIKKGLDGWFATYSDMVTLLFCFFVLLYASSTQDETRFQYIFQAFSSEGRYINTIVGQKPETPSEGENNSEAPPITPSGEAHGSPPGQTNEATMFDSLYASISEIISENEMQDVIETSSTPGQVRIRLQNDVLFDGDSYELKQSGREALDLITPSVNVVEDYVATVQVQGHTAHVGSVNTVIDDWDLSSLRATSVVKYLDHNKQMVDSEKFKAEGFAQYVPIAPNDTAEGRAKNRRVEIIITRIELSPEEHRLVDAIMQYDYNQGSHAINAQGDLIEPPPTPSQGIINTIIKDLNDKYGHVPSAEDTPGPQSAVGPSSGSLTQVDESEYLPDEESDNDSEAGEADEETDGDAETEDGD